MNFRSLSIATLLSLIVLPYVAAQTAAPTLAASALTAVPPLVPYSGQVEGRTAQSSANFLIYKDQTGGEPLFVESQVLSFDPTGHYKVQLGAANPRGLPPDLFSTGEARWLGVQVAGQPAEPRVLLASVPYALKAADAATLGGLPASAFALAGTNTAAVNATPAGMSPDAATTVTTTGGTANNLAKFSGANTIVNSTLYDNGTAVGVATNAPAATLDVNGTGLFSGLLITNGGETVAGTLEMAPLGTATAKTSYDSQIFKLYSSAYNSTSGAVVNPRFGWQARPTGNNTTAPSGTLNLLSSTTSAAPAATGFYFNTDGSIHFASGQTFPGSITSVGLSAPSSDFSVTGSPVTGAGTLGLNWKVAPSSVNNANAIVKRDGTGSFTAGAITANLGVEGVASASTGNGVTGINNGGGIAVEGQSTQAGGVGLQGNGDIIGVHGVTTGGIGAKGEGFIGVWGESTYTSGGGADGVHGVTGSAGASGVAGINSAGGNGVYGTGGTGVFGTGSNYGIVTDGNVQQARTAGGWIKAMLEVDAGSSTINRCFNSTLAGSAATTPPCGISLDHPGTGQYDLTFNFEVDDRFYTSQILYDSTLALALYRDGADNLLVWSYADSQGDLGDGDFQLIVY
jgi:hypothetical protein